MTEYGIAGGYTSGQIADLAQRRITPLLLEAEWAKAEPSEGRFAYGYFDSLRTTARAWQSAGHKVVLNFGMHHAPDWLLAKNGAKQVASDGASSGDGAADLITHSTYRFYGERYTSVFLSTVGTDWRMIRVGGGHWGELTYPGERDSGGRWRWYGYGPLSTNPVKTWRPGQASPNGEAYKYLTWYLKRLADFGLWQCQTVRRQYSGTIALLLPSWGMRPGDFTKAVNTNLNGSSSAEKNGEVQRGYDHAGQANKMARNSRVALWGTWANQPGSLDWIASLAYARGLKLAGENAADADLNGMNVAHEAVSRLNADLFLAIRASDAYSGATGWTIDDYSKMIA